MADNNTLLPYDGILRFDAVYDAENQKPAAASAATGVYLGRFVLEQDTNKIYQKIYKTGIGYDWRYVSQLGDYYTKSDLVTLFASDSGVVAYPRYDFDIDRGFTMQTSGGEGYINNKSLCDILNGLSNKTIYNAGDGINISQDQTISIKLDSTSGGISFGDNGLYIDTNWLSDHTWQGYTINNNSGLIKDGNQLSVNVDNTTIGLNSNGQLYLINGSGSGTSYTAGNGIKINSNNQISVNTNIVSPIYVNIADPLNTYLALNIDNNSLKLNGTDISQRSLAVKYDTSGGIAAGNNGIYVKLKSNGGISCNTDGELYLTNGSSGGITYTAENNGILIDNTNYTIGLQYNSNQFKITSAGLELTPVVAQIHWNSNDTLMEDSIQINNSSLKTQGGEFVFDLYENQINKLVSFYGAGTFVGDTLSGDITIWSSKLLGGDEVNASRPEDSCRCGIALITTNYNELPTKTKEVWLVRDAVPGSTKLIIKDMTLQSVSMGIILMGQYSRV